jgi:hypothetical protein
MRDFLTVLAAAFATCALPQSTLATDPPPQATIAAEPLKGLSYSAALAASVKTGKPLLVFVDLPDFAIAPALATDCIVCHVGELDGYPARCVVVSVPSGEKVYWFRTLERPTTDLIWRAIIQSNGPGPGRSSQSASPFGVNRVDGSDSLPVGSRDALDEVNELRAQQGLRPFVRDDGLTLAAARCASARAANGISGHTQNDFAYLPSGSSASAAGCAAWPQEMGFGACCVFESWTYAGAASVRGADGLMYHQVFVR